MEFAKVVSGGTEMKFGRHNKGEKVYDIFLANTDPSLVFFVMDVYWAVMGQQDPVEYIKKYAIVSKCSISKTVMSWVIPV